MARVRYSEQKTIISKIELNQAFHRGKALPRRFYRQFAEKGFILKQSILINCFPDSADMYFGHFIDDRRRVIEFDVDVEDPQYSSWTDVTDTYLDKKKKSRAVQTELDIVLRLFDELQTSGELTATNE